MVDLTMVMFLWGGDWLFLVRVEATHIVPQRVHSNILILELGLLNLKV